MAGTGQKPAGQRAEQQGRDADDDEGIAEAFERVLGRSQRLPDPDRRLDAPGEFDLPGQDPDLAGVFNLDRRVARSRPQDPVRILLFLGGLVFAVVTAFVAGVFLLAVGMVIFETRPDQLRLVAGSATAFDRDRNQPGVRAEALRRGDLTGPGGVFCRCVRATDLQPRGDLADSLVQLRLGAVLQFGPGASIDREVGDPQGNQQDQGDRDRELASQSGMGHVHRPSRSR